MDSMGKGFFPHGPKPRFRTCCRILWDAANDAANQFPIVPETKMRLPSIASVAPYFSQWWPIRIYNIDSKKTRETQNKHISKRTPTYPWSIPQASQTPK